MATPASSSPDLLLDLYDPMMPFLFRQPMAGFLLVAACCLAFCTTLSTAQDELAAVANGENGWHISPGKEPGPRFDLRHLAPAVDGLGFARLQGISQPPERMIAWRDQIFLVFPPPRSGEAKERQVLSLRVVHNEPLNVYYAMPRGRFRLEPSLPAAGEIVAAAATTHGPVVLIVDHAQRASQAAPPDAEAGRGPMPALLQLRSDGWRTISLPPTVRPNRTSHLAASGANAQTLVLLTESATSADRADVWRRSSDGKWTSNSVDFDPNRLQRITQLGDQAVVAMSTEGDRIEIAYLRRTGTMRIATVDRPEQPWTILGCNNRLMLVAEAGEDEPLQAAEIDVITGEIGDWLDVGPHETGQFKVWLTSLLIAAGMSAVLLFALLRPIRPAPVTRERNIRLSPLSLRAAALVIDLIPAAIPTLIITRCSLSDLAAVPLLLSDFFEAGPFFVMTGFMLAHATVGEMMTGRTIGKYIMGIRIVGQMVDEVRVYEVVLRNLGKGVSLAVPPLLLIVAMNPNLQGLGDIMGRTLVVRPRRAGPLNGLEPPDDDQPQP